VSGIQLAVPEHRTRAIRALAGLGRAITEASEALLAIPDDDKRTAYLCAGPLDTALADLASLLAAVPEIAGLGDPKAKVRESLDRSQAELSAERADVASHRVALDQLMETEGQLAEAATEAQELRDRIAALERVKRSVAEIPALRTMAAALEADIAVLDAADAPEVGERLASAIERLASVTEQQRATLSDEAATMIVRAETAASELGDLRARMDAAASEAARHEGETARLKAEHGDTLAMLAAWSRADLDLADGMRKAIPGTGDSPLESLVGELGGITQRLTELDGILRPLLATHARAYEVARQIRSP
jgi:DNA repair exonuclease SbcCD ATPase subunit